MPKSFSAELGAWKASVERRLDNLSSGSRLDHASLDGTTLYLKGDGELGRVGRQPDGSMGVHVAKVQPPPQLTAPILTVGEQAGTCLVEWDGRTFDGRRMPLIHGHTEVWAELVGEDWSPTVAPGDAAKRVGTIRDRTGGEVVVALPQAGTWAVWLRAMGADRETAGPWSPVSQVEISPLVDTEDIYERLDAADQEREIYIDEFHQRTDEYDAKFVELNEVRLPGIDDTLSEKAESSELDQLSTLLSGRERVHVGEGEPDDSTAARGITYEWTGTPHASESVKRAGGVEVARNRAMNPSFETAATRDWTFGSRVSSVGRTALVSRVRAGVYSTILSFEPGATQIQTLTRTATSVQPGQWVAVSMWATTTATGNLFADLVVTETTESGGHLRHNYLGEFQQLGRNEMVRFTFAYQVTHPDAGQAWGGIRFSNTQGAFSPPDGYAYLDAVHLAVAATESGALAQVEEYFDGDTEDVLDAPATEGTIYYQTDGDEIVAIWRRSADDWIKLPLRDEVFSSISVGKLVAGDASINEAVIDKLWSELGVFGRLDAREGWIGGVALEDNAVKARSVDAEEVFTNEAVARIVWAEIVRAGLLEADEGLIGGVLLKDGAVTLDKLNAIEEIASALVRTVELEAGTFKTNDMTAMRIVSSLIEATTYLIHNADGDVSVRLDGMENYIAGRLHAGMGENRGITMDYGPFQTLQFWDDEEQPPEVIDESITPYLEFHTDRNDVVLPPQIWVDESTGGMNISPGRLSGSGPGGGQMRIWGQVQTHGLRTRSIEVPTSSGIQPGGMARDGARTRLHGRTPSSSGSLDMFTTGRLGPYTPSGSRAASTTVTWAAPPEQGTRRPVVSGEYTATSHSNQWEMSVMVSSVSSSGFTLRMMGSVNGMSMWVNYNASWQ